MKQIFDLDKDFLKSFNTIGKKGLYLTLHYDMGTSIKFSPTFMSFKQAPNYTAILRQKDCQLELTSSEVENIASLVPSHLQKTPIRDVYVFDSNGEQIYSKGRASKK